MEKKNEKINLNLILLNFINPTINKLTLNNILNIFIILLLKVFQRNI